jgi:hypothetical protein
LRLRLRLRKLGSLVIMREKNRSPRDHAGSSNKPQAFRPFKFEMIRRLKRCDASMAGGPKCFARVFDLPGWY